MICSSLIPIQFSSVDFQSSGVFTRLFLRTLCKMNLNIFNEDQKVCKGVSVVVRF